MSALLDLLIAFFKKLFGSKDKKDPSIVVKNYINGNNNQNNGNNGHNDGRPGPAPAPRTGKPSPRPQGKTNAPRTPRNGGSGTRPVQRTAGTKKAKIRAESIRLYALGAKGKVYTDRFYRAINRNFGIEVVLRNPSSQTQTAKIGHCIYDDKGTAIINRNFHVRIAPGMRSTQHVYIEPDTFMRMKNGRYKSQFWIDDERVQKTYFTVVNK